MTETAAFWEKPGTDPKTINTEVVFLPAASFLEKEGSLSNSGRLVQWRYTGIKPTGDSKGELEVIDLLYRKLRELYATSTEEKDQIFKRAAWDYPKENMAEAVLQEINGRNLKTGEMLKGIADIQADGTTSSGCWIYAGVFGGGKNLSKRKDNKTDPSGLGLYREFAWSWPGNMKVLYNRASCDAQGQPLDKEHALIWWDAAQGRRRPGQAQWSASVPHDWRGPGAPAHCAVQRPAPVWSWSLMPRTCAVRSSLWRPSASWCASAAHCSWSMPPRPLVSCRLTSRLLSHAERQAASRGFPLGS
jgi:formate dehydrogenase major subunit